MGKQIFDSIFQCNICLHLNGAQVHKSLVEACDFTLKVSYLLCLALRIVATSYNHRLQTNAFASQRDRVWIIFHDDGMSTCEAYNGRSGKENPAARRIDEDQVTNDKTNPTRTYHVN